MRYACIVVVLAVAGCATPTYTPPTTFTVEPALDVAPAGQPTELTLGIRPLDAARPYREDIAYRDEGMVLGNYDNYRWAELPRDVVTRALLDALTATQKFKDVGMAAFMPRPNLILTGQLRRFDLVRTENPWVAEVEVNLALRNSQQPEDTWSATIEAREPLEKNDVSALPEAMSRAVSKIANDAANAIAGR